jgi:hypothetical protein
VTRRAMRFSIVMAVVLAALQLCLPQASKALAPKRAEVVRAAAFNKELDLSRQDSSDPDGQEEASQTIFLPVVLKSWWVGPPTPTPTNTLVPSLTPTSTRTPTVRPTPTITRTPVPGTKPSDGGWTGQTLTTGHADHPQDISFQVVGGGAEISAGMRLKTYAYERSGIFTCSGPVTWSNIPKISVGGGGQFSYSGRTIIGDTFTIDGSFITSTRAEGTFRTDILAGVCGRVANSGTWWADWQGHTSEPE